MRAYIEKSHRGHSFGKRLITTDQKVPVKIVPDINSYTSSTKDSFENLKLSNGRFRHLHEPIPRCEESISENFLISTGGVTDKIF